MYVAFLFCTKITFLLLCTRARKKILMTVFSVYLGGLLYITFKISFNTFIVLFSFRRKNLIIHDSNEIFYLNSEVAEPCKPGLMGFNKLFVD